MSEFENTVASIDEMMEDTSADDAQAMDDVVSIEELAANLTGDEGGETAENAGDSDPADEETQQETNQKKEDKGGRQIAAALKSQREKIFRDLGMSESEVRELVKNHRAEQMAKDDPDISPKAARRILDAQEKAAGGDQEAIKAGVQSLFDDGWTREELLAFCADAQVQSDLRDGKTVRQAATAYMRRGSAAKQTTKKSGVPTARNTAAGSVPARNRINDMSDDEFDALDRKMMAAAFAGKKIRFDQ